MSSTRILLFRGRCVENPELYDKCGMTGFARDEEGYYDPGDWVTGSLFDNGSECYILREIAKVTWDAFVPGMWVPVVPETVGQYTGLEDETGKEIYEGDIMQYGDRVRFVGAYYDHWKLYYYRDPSVLDRWFSTLRTERPSEWHHWKIIGNIHDNPDLIRQGE